MTHKTLTVNFSKIGLGIVFLVCLFSNRALAALSDSLMQQAKIEVSNLDYSSTLKLATKQSLINADLAVFYSDLALDKARKNKDTEGSYRIYRERGFIYEENNFLEKALNEFEHALIAANEMDNDKKRLTIYNDLAITNRKLSNYKTATDYHSMCLFIAEKTSDQIMMENSYHGLGYLYRVIGDYDKAVEYYFKSLAIAEDRKATSGVIITLQHISHTFLLTDHKQKSIDNIERAYKLATALGDSLHIANVLYDYGKSHAELGEHEKALNKLSYSLAFYKKLNRKKAIVGNLIEIADIHTKMGALDKAQDHFQVCFDEYENYMSTKNRSKIHNKQAFLFKKLEETQRAETAFQKSLEISKKHDYKALSQENHLELYQIFRKKGDTQNALVHLEASNNLLNYIQNAEKSQRIAEMQFQYEVEQGARKIQELRYSRNQVLFFAISLFLGAIALFFFYTNKIRVVNNRELKQKNTAFGEQNKKLEESNLALSQFAYVAAHDLKEPLRNIGSFISLLQKKYGSQFNEEANTYMNYVQTGAKRMNNLLVDLLEFSTLTTQEASNEIVNIRSIIKEVSRNLQDTISTKKAIIDYPENMPSIRMKRIHLLQVLQNLISNSLKFVEGPPRISIQYFPEPEHILLMVEDNGIGINEDYKNKVFKLFHQLEKNKGYEGTGIGLTICKSIVEKYNGQIWFESRLKMGTRFFIRLPLHEEISKEISSKLVEKPEMEEVLS